MIMQLKLVLYAFIRHISCFNLVYFLAPLLVSASVVAKLCNLKNSPVFLAQYSIV